MDRRQQWTIPIPCNGIGHTEHQPMSKVSYSNSKDGHTISIDGDFVFELNRTFRSTYQQVPANQPVVVDLSKTPYIDSAGLGMLVRLHEHAGGKSGAVTIVGANEMLKKIFEVAKFDRMFTIK